MKCQTSTKTTQNGKIMNEKVEEQGFHVGDLINTNNSLLLKHQILQ